MSHVATQSHGSQRSGSLGNITSFFLKLAGSMMRRVQLRNVERHLEAMDDRLLNDIGLERADIHSAVWRGRKL